MFSFSYIKAVKLNLQMTLHFWNRARRHSESVIIWSAVPAGLQGLIKPYSLSENQWNQFNNLHSVYV